jgi:flagellin
MVSVVTNKSAILARLSSLKHTGEFNLAAGRLSSGKRINNAGDDAAGNSVSLKMGALIDGKNMAMKTIGDGIALLEVQDSGLAELENIVLRLRELALQMASGSYTDTDRSMAQIEFEALGSQISNLVLSTTFNTRKTINGANASGSNKRVMLQAGSGAGETIQIEQGAGKYIGNQIQGGAISIDTVSNAKSAITVLDTALSDTLTARAISGASKNRLMSVVANLSASGVLASQSLGRIVDADMAREASQLSKSKILNDASTAMLASANTSQLNLLRLVGVD